MERKNVTLSLAKLLLKKAKMIATSEDKSLSEFLKESLEKKVREATGYQKAKTRQSKLIKEGIDLGTNGTIIIKREEIHARR